MIEKNIIGIISILIKFKKIWLSGVNKYLFSGVKVFGVKVLINIFIIVLVISVIIIFVDSFIDLFFINKLY